MKVAIPLGLLLLAAAHLLLPWSILAEARAIDPSLATTLLVELRLPRTLLAVGYGAALGVSGAAIQAAFANPLASPDISGASSGAALGAVVAMYWLGLASPLGLALAGMAGAGLALFALVLLAGRRAETATLLLAGLAITLAAGAATSLALALAPSPFAFYDAFDWLMGGFVDRSLGQAAAALFPAGIAALLLLRLGPSLDLLALGEDVIAASGRSPRDLVRSTLIFSAVAVGACVSVCGAIGFVGLAAPVLARAMVRGHPGRAMLPAAAIGAALMTAADLVVRAVPLQRTLPVGVVTALLGAPFFLALVINLRRRTIA
ncbi:iron ABC transporter permease [Sphingomonas sp. ASV193]|uniref:FecCD family ABC transporter permease n=1 Tax=Sphingomonas sp. ASV193 TaxID=3144405 RepID=UPI0032E930BC